MRVEGATGRFGDTPGKEPIRDKKRVPAGSRPVPSRPPSFVEELQGALAEEPPGDRTVEQLIAEVDEAGKELLGRPNGDHLRRYREAVKNFLVVAVRRSFRVHVVEGRGAHPKLYVVVDKIESRLDELARQVLAAHRNPLRLLAQVEELRGLLLDLKT